MTDIFEKIQNDFNEFMKQAKELVEKERVAEASKTKRWKPKDNDMYFFIDSVGMISEDWYTCGCKTDVFRNTTSNCFQTKEEAQKELDRRLAEQELLDMCDWGGGEKVYLIEYNDQRDFFDWNLFDYIYSPYRFATQESCQKAIDTLGTEKLKLIFRIDQDINVLNKKELR